jgi:hypothetical protein
VTDRKHAVLIFSKSAEAGKVKTRLRSLLTETQRLELHLALLSDVLAKAQSADADAYLYLSGSAPLPFDPGIPILQQRGDGLGERLCNAFAERLTDHEKVLIVGIDSPTFEPGIYPEAFRLLATHEIVLGPAEDGGYYLIGLSKPVPELFSGIDWGTERVLKQTLAAAANRPLALLPPCYDIDTPRDLHRLRSELSESAHWPHTAQWLRSIEDCGIKNG